MSASDADDASGPRSPAAPPALKLLGGGAALLGGVGWSVKSLAILVTGVQPPLIFGAGPTLFGLAVVAMAAHGGSRRRTAALVAGLCAVGAGAVAVATDAVGDLLGPAIAVAAVSLLVGLLLLDRRGDTRLAWWLGAATLPALLAGGALSLIHERLLEVPLLALGAAWIVVGVSMVRSAADAALRPAGDVGTS